MITGIDRRGNDMDVADGALIGSLKEVIPVVYVN
jgi:hypothetical protein